LVVAAKKRRGAAAVQDASRSIMAVGAGVAAVAGERRARSDAPHLRGCGMTLVAQLRMGLVVAAKKRRGAAAVQDASRSIMAVGAGAAAVAGERRARSDAPYLRGCGMTLVAQLRMGLVVAAKKRRGAAAVQDASRSIMAVGAGAAAVAGERRARSDAPYKLLL